MFSDTRDPNLISFNGFPQREEDFLLADLFIIRIINEMNVKSLPFPLVPCFMAYRTSTIQCFHFIFCKHILLLRANINKVPCRCCVLQVYGLDTLVSTGDY